MNAKPYVVVLSFDGDGTPVYLGKLDLGRQGVRKLANAFRYARRGNAKRVADDYPGATVRKL